MLRAIAGYFLGGILNETPQETVECETKEVNDWLVVNMPDKPEEGDLDFDSDSDTESVIDEDDVLTCVPMLMSTNQLEYNNVMESKNNIVEYNNDVLEYENDVMEYDNDVIEYGNDVMKYKNDVTKYDSDIFEFTKNVVVEYSNRPPKFNDQINAFRLFPDHASYENIYEPRAPRRSLLEKVLDRCELCDQPHYRMPRQTVSKPAETIEIKREFNANKHPTEKFISNRKAIVSEVVEKVKLLKRDLIANSPKEKSELKEELRIVRKSAENVEVKKRDLYVFRDPSSQRIEERIRQWLDLPDHITTMFPSFRDENAIVKQYPAVFLRKPVIERIKVKYPRKKGLIPETYQKEKNPDLTCHTIHSPTYLNHRPLITAAKTDLLQQIKEIEPSQKAKEIALKKNINRSQLNRQNKNYIYCSSAKMSRRKDLQRNHSGANNNRRC